MSDQKKWFKVWATILVDPHHAELSLEDVGRWTRLGAYLVSVGCNGKIAVSSPGLKFCEMLGLRDLEECAQVLVKLPNIEAKYANGTITVTMLNWRKFQEDSTIAERVTRLRRKRRGEEKKEKDVTAFDFKDVKVFSGFSKFSKNGKTPEEMKRLNDQEFEKLLEAVKQNPKLSAKPLEKKSEPLPDTDDEEIFALPDMSDAPSSKPGNF